MALLTRLRDGWKAYSQGTTDLATPDVTRVQTLALGQAVIVVLIVLGFNLDPETQQLLIALSAALGAGLPLSDAVVRRGRSANATDVAAAKTTVAAIPPTSDAGDGAPATDPLGLSAEDREAIVLRLAQLGGDPEP